MKHLFSSDHSHFFVKSSRGFQPKHEHKPLPKLKHDFVLFAWKNANWNEINHFINDQRFGPCCKSNVDLMVDFWYEWFYDILQDFPTKQHRFSTVGGNESSRSKKKLKFLQNFYRKKQTCPESQNWRNSDTADIITRKTTRSTAKKNCSARSISPPYRGSWNQLQRQTVNHPKSTGNRTSRTMTLKKLNSLISTFNLFFRKMTTGSGLTTKRSQSWSASLRAKLKEQSGK